MPEAGVESQSTRTGARCSRDRTPPGYGEGRVAARVTAHIHLLEGLPLRELDARAEGAVRELEDGAVTVAVIDDSHRVDRIGVIGKPRVRSG